MLGPSLRMSKNEVTPPPPSADPEGGGGAGGPDPPLENHKLYGFL